MTRQAATGVEHTVAVVVPVYRGEETLPSLVEELQPCVEAQVSPGGTRFRSWRSHFGFGPSCRTGVIARARPGGSSGASGCDAREESAPLTRPLPW